MSSERIRLVVKEVGMQPRLVEQPRFQNHSFDYVGKLIAGKGQKEGHVAFVKYNERITMLVNEDGRKLGMRANFIFGDNALCGTVVFGRVTPKGLIDLTDADIAEVIRFFAGRDDLQRRENEDRCFKCDEVLDGTDHDCPAA